MNINLDWTQILLAVATLVLAFVGWLVQRFFNAVDDNLKHLPLIREELAKSSVHREHDKARIDEHHQRLNRHGELLQKHEGQLIRIEGVIDTEQE